MEKDFFKYQAQTTPHPLALEVSKAKGSFIYDSNQKKYLDFIASVPLFVKYVVVKLFGK